MHWQPKTLASLLFVIAASFSLRIDMAMAQSKTNSAAHAKYKDWNVAYEVNGKGDATLILVHGWGADSSSWSAQLDSLDFDGRVVAIDLLGHGRSDKPEIDYTLDVLSGSVVAVMDDLGLTRATLAGHSNGVPVCCDVLHKYPSRVQALIIVDGPLKSVIPELMAREMSRRIGKNGFKQLAEQMRGYLSPNKDLAQEQIDNVVQAFENTPEHVLASTFESQFREGYFKENKISVPTLAIYAQNQMWSAWDEEYEAFVRKLVPGVEYHCWQASHLVHLEQATRFNKLVSKFVKELKQAESDDESIPRFDLRVGYWINLHSWLKACAASERDRVAKKVGLDLSSQLDQESRAAVAEVVARYQKRMAGRSEIHDPEFREIDRLLSLQDDSDDLTRFESRFPEWAHDLKRAEPVFRRFIWPRNESILNNIRSRAKRLANEHGSLFAETSRLFQNPFPSEAVVVDFVIYANWAGAYTTTSPPHIRLAPDSEFENDYALLESIVHESTHLILSPRKCPVADSIAKAFENEKARAPHDLWHAIMFYAVGDLVQELAQADGFNYVTYADRHSLYKRSTWLNMKRAMQQYWAKYSDGKQNLEGVLRNIAKELVAENDAEASNNSLQTGVIPLLLVEKIEPCVPFWIDGLGFEEHIAVKGEKSLDFLELRRGPQSLMFQSRDAIEQDPTAPDVTGKPFSKNGTILYVHLDESIDAALRRLDKYPVVIKRRTKPYGLEEVGLLAPGEVLVVIAAPPSNSELQSPQSNLGQRPSTNQQAQGSNDLETSPIITQAKAEVELASIEVRRHEAILENAVDEVNSNLSDNTRKQLELDIERARVKLQIAINKLEIARKSIGLDRSKK